MNLYLVLWISGACIAFSEGWHKVFEAPLKPFSCPSCLSLWVGIGVSLITGNFLYMFVPFVVTKIIMKFLWS